MNHIFFDRDGTLIKEKEYLSNPKRIDIYEDSIDSLLDLQQEGYQFIIVSNQSGVARGKLTRAQVREVHESFLDKMKSYGIYFLKSYFSFYHPNYVDPSSPYLVNDRKPNPRLAYIAAAEFQLDLSKCYMVGDKLSDVQFGINANMKKSFLTKTGYGFREFTSNPSFFLKNKNVSFVSNVAGILPEILDYEKTSK